ncbi:hypothetical protein AB4Z40_10475 [Bosea sp. 2YAB26]|uniref:hypothetical protein n=1 Tax=Bosea sp. 2YAB26 TaxID=3237478 RepID=UPI003F900F03
MISPSDRFLANWNAEEALVWIVTRQLSDVLTPGFWQQLKRQHPAGATAAEADLLRLLRSGSVMSLERKDDLDSSNPGWRARETATELDRWPDCYAHPTERFAPSGLMEVFPSECLVGPISDGGRVTLFQLAHWMGCRLSLITKRSAQSSIIDDLLLASSRQKTGLLLWGWRGPILTGDPEPISPDAVSALLQGDCTVTLSAGIPGFGKCDGCAFLGDKGVLWSGLHYLEPDTRLISEGYDFSSSFREIVCAGKLDLPVWQPATFGNGHEPAIPPIVPERLASKRHKGAPYIDDAVWLQRMRKEVDSGLTANKAATKIVSANYNDIEGASFDAKQSRLRRKFREGC